MELPQPRRQGLLGKNLEKPAAILPAPERRAGDGAALGRQLAPTFYSRLLGVTVWRHAQRHTHEHTNTDRHLWRAADLLP